MAPNLSRRALSPATGAVSANPPLQLARMPSTARLDAQHYHSGQYTGHMVRVAGRLLVADGERVQIQMAGEGACEECDAAGSKSCMAGTPHSVRFFRYDSGAPATVIASGHHAGAFDPSAVGKGHYEVVGTLQNDGTLMVASVLDLGESFGALGCKCLMTVPRCIGPMCAHGRRPSPSPYVKLPCPLLRYEHAWRDGGAGPPIP